MKMLLTAVLSGFLLCSKPMAADAPPLASQTEEKVDHGGAVRLLQQASFGPTHQTVKDVLKLGYRGWIDQQLSLPLQTNDYKRTIEIAKMARPEINWLEQGFFNGDAEFAVGNYQLSTWWENALSAEDQLRHRVAFALSQILVVSTSEPPLHNRAEALAVYNDLLVKHAFGNFRGLLSDVARSAAMGVYLSHQGNRKANEKKQTSPDENFARELMQLFTLGLYRLNNDGTALLDEQAQLIPIYQQSDVTELARVFTGWDLQSNKHFGDKNKNRGDYSVPMEFTEAQHDFGAKTVLGVTIPEKLTGDQDLEAALDILFNHPNIAPFISRQLIQRLVSSNPSAEYIERVASVFIDNGQGKRGDLAAVIKATLIDSEARAPKAQQYTQQGKLKEPVLALSALLRLLEAQPIEGWTTKQGGVMSGVYWVTPLNIGQAPFRSPSVFNFYSPDAVPPDSEFRKTEQVAPELEVLTAPALIEFSNLIERLMHRQLWQKYQGSYKNYRKFLQENNAGAIYVMVDLHSFMQPYQAQLSKIDLSDPEESVQQHQRALNRLLTHFERFLLSEPLSNKDRQELVAHLQSQFNQINNQQQQREAVIEMVRFITVTANFWVQR